MTPEERGKLEALYDDVRGSWNRDKPGKRLRGILERLSTIEILLITICLVLAVRVIGVPTEKIFPLVLQFFTHAGG